MTAPADPDGPDDGPSDGPTAGGGSGDGSALAPLVVVSGEATEEEVAALTAVVAALGAAQVEAAAVPASRPVSQWAARSRQVRGPHVAGPGGWRSSTLPR